MTSEKDEEYFACLKVSPAQMDFLWAEGWRHFGIYFFRYQTSFHGDKQFSVMPLRIDLGRFSLTRSQKRVLTKNRDTRIVIRPAAVDPGKHELFNKHRVRFKDNIPTSLEDIVSPLPARCPVLVASFVFTWASDWLERLIWISGRMLLPLFTRFSTPRRQDEV